MKLDVEPGGQDTSRHPKACLEALRSRAGPPDTSRRPISCLQALRSRAGPPDTSRHPTSCLQALRSRLVGVRLLHWLLRWPDSLAMALMARMGWDARPQALLFDCGWSLLCHGTAETPCMSPGVRWPQVWVLRATDLSSSVRELCACASIAFILLRRITMVCMSDS